MWRKENTWTMKKIQFQQNQITLWNNKLSVAYFRVYIEIVKYTESTESTVAYARIRNKPSDVLPFL